MSFRQLPVVASLKFMLRWGGILLAAAALLLATSFAVFSLWFLPNLEHYRDELATLLSRQTGRVVTIRQLQGQWLGVAPRLDLYGVTMANPREGAALSFDHVSLTPAWRSLLVWSPRFSHIAVDGPVIDLVRGRDGVLYLNGFDISSGGAGQPGDGSAANWWLNQSSLVINNAKLSWQDELLGLPRFRLDKGQAEFSSGLFGHGLKITGQPSAALGRAIALSARWRGDDVRAWKEWQGELRVDWQGVKVSPWSRYLQQWGGVRSGEGDGVFEVAFNQGRIDRLKANIDLKNAAYAPTNVGELNVPKLGGQLDVVRDGDKYRIEARNLTLASTTGLAFDRSRISGFWAKNGGDLKLDNASLTHLTPLIHALGADKSPLFARFTPSGKLQDVSVSWQGRLEAPAKYSVASGFQQLAWAETGPVPGVAGVSGQIRFDQAGGRLQLDAGASALQLSRVFPKPLAFDHLKADVDWAKTAGGVDVTFNRMDFGNRDLQGWLSGHYRYPGRGAGQIDLKGGIDRVQAVRVPDYLPYEAGTDTIKWLRAALKGGEARKVSLVLKGNLDDFPFKGGRTGEFLVEAQVEQGQLEYEPGWPKLDDITALLRFHNEKMEILSSRASTLGMPLSDVRVGIADLGAAAPVLDIKGKAKGELSKLLAFTTHSPVDGWLGGFTGQIQATGPAGLDLTIAVPLSAAGESRVTGDLSFAGNRLAFTHWPIPVADGVRGVLRFTEKGVASNGLRLTALGGPFTLRAATEPSGRMNFRAEGEAASAQVLQGYVPLLAPYAIGHSRFAVDFAIGQGLESLTVRSDLKGTAITAPAPASKAAGEAWPLLVSLQPGKAPASGWHLGFNVDKRAGGRLRLSEDGTLRAAQIAVGRPVGEPQAPGLTIRVAQPAIALKPWQALLKGKTGDGQAGAADWPWRVELDVGRLEVGARQFSGVSARVGKAPDQPYWRMTFASDQLTTDADYFPAGRGRLKAKIARLALPLPASASQALAPSSPGEDESLPELDVEVGNLLYSGRSVGKLDLHAVQSGKDWLLDRFSLQSGSGSLQGSARASTGPAPVVDVNFKLQSANLGELLERFGYGDTFRKGEGMLDGKLRWPGGLTDYELSRLSGEMSVNFRNGRFAKVNPGAARLLGVLSLQSLPRRIRLDFTDMFSDGFAFDSLTGRAAINNGVFASDNVAMSGPAAAVGIKGRVDLNSETQDIRVRVEPRLSESVALATGAALLNPLAGVAALAAQKLLQDPVGKIFSVDYEVKGSLTDPVVNKVGAAKADQEKTK